MSLYDGLFIICFFLCLIIIGVKAFNIINLCKNYDIKISGALFVLWYLSYGILFVVVMTSAAIAPTKVIFISLFNFITWLQLLNVAFLITEIFFHWADVVEVSTKPYTPDWFWNDKNN